MLNLNDCCCILRETDNISQAHFEKNQRLEVKLRPENIYCKPVFSRATKVSNLVLRVKKRRRRTVRREVDGGGREGGEGQTLLATPGEMMQQGEPKADYEYSAEVLGVVNTSYTFSGTYTYSNLPFCISRSSPTVCLKESALASGYLFLFTWYSNVVWWISEQPDSHLKFCAIVAVYEGIVLFQKLYIAIQQHNFD